MEYLGIIISLLSESAQDHDPNILPTGREVRAMRRGNPNQTMRRTTTNLDE